MHYHDDEPDLDHHEHHGRQSKGKGPEPGELCGRRFYQELSLSAQPLAKLSFFRCETFKIRVTLQKVSPWKILAGNILVWKSAVETFPNTSR